MYLFWGSMPLVVLSPLLLVAVFMWLLAKNAQLHFQRDYLLACIRINENELKALKGDYSFANNGARFGDPKHAYSNDIDLFGEGGFFERLNRTSSEKGCN
jgi:hypothetical protein